MGNKVADKTEKQRTWWVRVMNNQMYVYSWTNQWSQHHRRIFNSLCVYHVSMLLEQLQY